MNITTPRTTRDTQCSGCMVALVITNDEIVTARIPSNGVRGSKHVPARLATSEIYSGAGAASSDLLMWDCPACDYADSLDISADDARTATITTHSSGNGMFYVVRNEYGNEIGRAVTRRDAESMLNADSEI